MLEVTSTFYARILGGVLFGVGLALVFEAYPDLVDSDGLSLAGAVAINLGSATMLALTLLFLRSNIPL